MLKKKENRLETLLDCVTFFCMKFHTNRLFGFSDKVSKNTVSHRSISRYICVWWIELFFFLLVYIKSENILDGEICSSVHVCECSSMDETATWEFRKNLHWQMIPHSLVRTVSINRFVYRKNVWNSRLNIKPLCDSKLMAFGSFSHLVFLTYSVRISHSRGDVFLDKATRRGLSISWESALQGFPWILVWGSVLFFRYHALS